MWRARQALARIAEGGAAARAELPIEPAAAQAALATQRIVTSTVGGTQMAIDTAIETGGRRPRSASPQIVEDATAEAGDKSSRATEMSASTKEAVEPAISTAFATDAAASVSEVLITRPESSQEQAGTEVQPAALIADSASHARVPAGRPTPDRWYCSGLPTGSAGFFFLLNAVRQVGVAEALAAGLGQARPDFAFRVLLRLAAHAGVAQDDPISIWLHSLLNDANDGGDELLCDESCWPLNCGLRERPRQSTISSASGISACAAGAGAPQK